MANLPQNLDSIMKALGSKRKIYEGKETEAVKMFKQVGASPNKKIAWGNKDYGSKDFKMYQSIKEWTHPTSLEWDKYIIMGGYKVVSKEDKSEIYFIMNGDTQEYECYIN